MTVGDSASESKPRRLFFALWPTPALQQQLYALARPLLEQAQGARRTQAENLHLTLAFLGSVDAKGRACLEQRAEEIRVPSFELVFEQLGFFRGGTWWVGTERVPSPLRTLVNALKAAQAACGLSPENREYQAHVTLARDLRRRPPPLSFDPIVWPVRQFALVRSQTAPDGARYEVLRRWPLEPPVGK